MEENTIEGPSASVSGGCKNNATGQWGSISCGFADMASNESSSVSGGFRNRAGGRFSSVLGGRDLNAIDLSAAMAQNRTEGGTTRTAPQTLHQIGRLNMASSNGASVSGGTLNIATSVSASVSGGYGNKASGALLGLVRARSIAPQIPRHP